MALRDPGDGRGDALGQHVGPDERRREAERHQDDRDDPDDAEERRSGGPQREVAVRVGAADAPDELAADPPGPGSARRRSRGAPAPAARPPRAALPHPSPSPRACQLVHASTMPRGADRQPAGRSSAATHVPPARVTLGLWTGTCRPTGPELARSGPASRAGPRCTAASGRRPSSGSGWAGCNGSPATGPVARVSPDALSVTGVAVAGAAALVAGAGGRWPLLAAVLVVLVGVLDGLDGAVALHTGRARPLGAVVDAMADRRRRPAPARDARRAGCAAGVVRRGGSADLPARVPAGPRRRRRDARGRCGDRGRAPDAPGAGGGGLPGRRHPARGHSADGLGLGDGVRDRLGGRRRGRARPPVDRRGADDPGLPGTQAGPTRSATIFADRATIGSPPPGCAEPPTRNSPGTGDRFAGRSSAAQEPCDAVP